MSLLRLGISILVVAALHAVTGTAAGAAGTPGPSGRAQLARFSCGQGLNPADRAVSVRAVMRPLLGTRRLSIKFELAQRASGAPPAMVHGGDLGVWLTPGDPTLGQLPGDVWRLDKAVLNLAAPASYQFRVMFRWVGAHGRVLGAAVRWSQICRQRDLRPDLTVTAPSVSPLARHPDQDLYTAVVANEGPTGAGPFEVRFVPGGSAAPTPVNLPSLRAGGRRTVSFAGPVCDPADPPSVTADAAHRVPDANRANNTATVVCPASGST